MRGTDTGMSLLAPEKTDSADLCTESWTVETLPPFPAVALRALNLIAGTHSSLHDLCDLIGADPAFTAAVLRLANSPLIGFPKQITSVLQASMLLGFNRLKSVVITLGLRAYFEERCTPMVRACWRHSLACAIVAEQCASAAHLDKDFAHTAGILHDIGRVAMAASMPRSYARVLETEAGASGELLAREREICGIDHCQAGLALVQAWNLPVAFGEITYHHHEAQHDFGGVASLVCSGCLLADAVGFPVARYRAQRTYDEILAGFPERVRGGLPRGAKDLTAWIKKEIRVIESA